MTSIVEYSETEAALASLSAKYKGVVFDVTTREGMQAAKESRKVLAGYRIALEKKRVEIKAPALKRSQEIDTEARRITRELEALENPIASQIYNEEQKAQLALEAKVRAEQERIAAEERARKEAEEAKLAAERAELAQRRAALEAAERASREKIEAAERAARRQMEEEARQERLARQAREEVERQKRASEEARLKAERDKLDAERRAVEEQKRKEQAEAEAKAKAIRDAEEVKQRTIRLEALAIADARNTLRIFRETYGHRQEFANIVAAIDEYMIALGEPA